MLAEDTRTSPMMLSMICSSLSTDSIHLSFSSARPPISCHTHQKLESVTFKTTTKYMYLVKEERTQYLFSQFLLHATQKPHFSKYITLSMQTTLLHHTDPPTLTNTWILTLLAWTTHLHTLLTHPLLQIPRPLPCQHGPPTSTPF